MTDIWLDPFALESEYDPFALDNGAEDNGGVSRGRQAATPRPIVDLSEWLSEDDESTGRTSPVTSLVIPDLPSPRDPQFAMPNEPDLPGWVERFRETQWQAIEEVLDAYRRGVDIVWLDAPTGTGKTLIAEAVRRLLRARAVYVCHGKSLQDQFVGDFQYAKVLKGRSNYPTLSMPYPEYTAADCTKEGAGEDAMCYWCPNVQECPYEKAKAEAIRAPLTVLNTSYLLTEANYVGTMSRNKFAIADECDVLEKELMGFVTYELSERRLERLRLEAPKKGVRKKTILGWLEEWLVPAIMAAIKVLPEGSNDIRVLRERQSLGRLYQDTLRVVRDLTLEIERGQDYGEGQKQGAENWVRDNDAGPLVLKPVKVDEYGQGVFWRHSERWLCMSATIVSTEEMNESLGVNVTVEGQDPLVTETVSVPMTFPIENRQIIAAPVANMIYAEKDRAWPKLAKAIGRIMERHPDERILVHSVSYDLTRYLVREIRSPRVITYSSGKERDQSLARFSRTPGGVLIAPSMDRGVDLKDDLCRVVVVAKVPFPFLGDRQVSSRLRGAGGQVWYTVQAIRSLVQMTGRGVRNEQDWCVTYILDAQFVSKIWKKARGYLPEWWKEAVSIVRTRDYE